MLLLTKNPATLCRVCICIFKFFFVIPTACHTVGIVFSSVTLITVSVSSLRVTVTLVILFSSHRGTVPVCSYRVHTYRSIFQRFTREYEAYFLFNSLLVLYNHGDSPHVLEGQYRTNHPREAISKFVIGINIRIINIIMFVCSTGTMLRRCKETCWSN